MLRTFVSRAKVEEVRKQCISAWSRWMSKYRNGHNIPSETPERLGRWWLQAKRMQSPNLCWQLAPTALLHLGNVLLNEPQNCLETTALLSLILDDPAKTGIHHEEWDPGRKVGLKAFLCVCGHKERMVGNVILFTVTRILLAEAMGFEFLICI